MQTIKISVDNVFFPLISMIIALIQVKPLRERFKWCSQAHKEVGNFGMVYNIVVKVPLWFTSSLLGLVIFICVGALIAIALYLNQTQLPPIVIDLIEKSYFIFIIYIILAMIIHFNPISRLLLSLTKLINHFRFKPGWVNSDYHLNHFKSFFALNVDREQCESFANVVFDFIRKEKKGILPEQAPAPAGLSQDEKANYILIGCAIESWIHILYKNNPGILQKSWQY